MTPSYVKVYLDTTAPTVNLLVAGTVSPPDDIVVRVMSSEDMGWVNLSFIDSLGEGHAVGFERIDAQNALATIPTTLVSTGEGTFRALVADSVDNLAVVTQSITVGATRPFDVVVEFQRGLELDEGVYHAYDVMISIEKG